MPKRPNKLVMFRVSGHQMLMGCRDGGKNYPLGSEGLVVSGETGGNGCFSKVDVLRNPILKTSLKENAWYLFPNS